MLRTTTAVQTRRMPSIFAKLQDKGHEMLFGKDGGTGKCFLWSKSLVCLVKLYSFDIFSFSVDKTSFYSLVDRDMEGNEVKMDTFKGDVLCVVNVASKWGLTKQNYGEFIIMCW